MLLIDDDWSVVCFTQWILEEAGFVVDVAMDGRQGLAEALAAEHDAILLDHDLPFVKGIDVLRALHDASVTTPVVMITGKGDEQLALEAGRLGARGYIRKPFHPTDVVQAVARVLAEGPSSGTPAADRRGVTYITSPSLEPPAPGPAPERPIYRRWVQAVLALVTADRDSRVEEEWASCAGASVATLRQWHRVARLPVGRSHLLARALRAASLARKFGGSLEEFLNASDRRTIERIVALAGAEGERPSVADILVRQHLVSNRFAMVELERALRTAGLL